LFSEEEGKKNLFSGFGSRSPSSVGEEDDEDEDNSGTSLMRKKPYPLITKHKAPPSKQTSSPNDEEDKP
jgi:hypothetical protein